MENLAIHCEQLGNSSIQWLNLITNIVFFFFSLLFFESIKKNSRIQIYDRIMIFSLIFLGIGSFFWHAFPAKWTNYLDLGSVILFSSIVITLVINKTTNNLKLKIFLVSLIVVIGIFLKQIPVLNNSLAYIYLMFLIFIMAFGLPVINKSEAKIYFRRAFILFILGFIAHKTDLMICNFLVTGSHFMWHVFVAGVGYYFAKGIHILYSTNR